MSIKNLFSNSLIIPDFPVGGLMMWPTINEDIPNGWLKCNGDQYTISEYEELFYSIGYTFGGSGSVFNVPNQIYLLDGITLIGWEDGVSNVGDIIGENYVTLTEENAITDSHTHESTVTNTEHTHSLTSYLSGGTGSGGTGTPTFIRNFISNFSLQSASIASSNITLTNELHPGAPAQSPHINIQPATGIEYIIRAYAA